MVGSVENVEENTAITGKKTGVCPYCLDVWLYCWCVVENPICRGCSKALTECECPGATRKRLDRWADDQVDDADLSSGEV